MLISKRLLSVAKVASTDDTRPVLTAVKVYREGDKTIAVATDSYMLSEVRETTPKLADFPTLMDGRLPKDPEEVLIPARTALKAMAGVPNKPTLSILGNALLEDDRITTTDLEETAVLGFKAIEGNYPDYRKLIPAEDEVGRYTVTLDPRLLAEALNQFKGDRVIRLSVSSSKLSPVTLRSENMGVDTTVVVMPLKS